MRLKLNGYAKLNQTNNHSFIYAALLNMANLNMISYFLNKNILTGLNFKDWFRNLKLVLIFEKIRYLSDRHVPNSLLEGSSEEEQVTWEEIKE